MSFPGVSSKRVSATNPNLLEEGRLDYSSLEEDLPEVFDQVGNSWVEKMATEEFKKDLAQLKEIEQDARDLMDDLRVCDVNVWRTKSVDNDLKKIWDLATRFRAEVRSFKVKYKDALTDTDGSNLDNQDTNDQAT